MNRKIGGRDLYLGKNVLANIQKAKEEKVEGEGERGGKGQALLDPLPMLVMG